MLRSSNQLVAAYCGPADQDATMLLLNLPRWKHAGGIRLVLPIRCKHGLRVFGRLQFATFAYSIFF